MGQLLLAGSKAHNNMRLCKSQIVSSVIFPFMYLRSLRFRRYNKSFILQTSHRNHEQTNGGKCQKKAILKVETNTILFEKSFLIVALNGSMFILFKRQQEFWEFRSFRADAEYCIQKLLHLRHIQVINQE